MRVIEKPIEAIKPYENNPRKISAEAVDKVMASIKEFGFQQPIVVDKDMIIIVGHTRLMAAKKLGLDNVPVIVADNLTDEQARAYRLADIIQQWGRGCLSIVDLFGGSGSTLIACEQLQRKCYMMELDPYYCQVIIDRWEQFTGKKAVKVR